MQNAHSATKPRAVIGWRVAQVVTLEEHLTCLLVEHLPVLIQERVAELSRFGIALRSPTEAIWRYSSAHSTPPKPDCLREKYPGGCWVLGSRIMEP